MDEVEKFQTCTNTISEALGQIVQIAMNRAIDDALRDAFCRIERALQTIDEVANVLTSEEEVQAFTEMARRLATNTLSRGDLHAIIDAATGKRPSAFRDSVTVSG